MPYRVLVTDEIDPEGVALLTAESNLEIDEVPTLPVPELMARIASYDAIVGRSATRISAELLHAGTKLKVVGRAGVGVDNIAMDVATQLGIAVINAPAGNTIAVAELFFGVVLGILRHLARVDTSMREGRWDRSAFMGTELRGKTLGIIGLGRIGGEVAKRAAAFGMHVIAYDPYIAEDRFQSHRVTRIDTLDQVLTEADLITVHVPLTDETYGMIGTRELALVPPNAIVVNMARGGIIDEDALLTALRTGRLRAAAVDAFSKEPLAKDSPLRNVDGLYLTPHIGASTAEAQRNVAVDACVAVRDALLKGELSPAINLAQVGAPGWKELWSALDLTRKLAAVARALLASQGTLAVSKIDIRCGDAYAASRGGLLAAAAVGVLDTVTETERLNIINARALAEARGIEFSFTDAPQTLSSHVIEVRLSGGVHELAVGGIAHPNTLPRITRIGTFHVDVHPRETLLILTNTDVPGVIGRVGTLLGEAGVNIAEYHQARLAQGGNALAAVSVDGTITPEIRDALLKLPDINSATAVTFRGNL